MFIYIYIYYYYYYYLMHSFEISQVLLMMMNSLQLNESRGVLAGIERREWHHLIEE